MAKIGLNNFRYSTATIGVNGSITYGTPKKPAKAVSFTFTPTLAEGKLYADDALAEYVSEVVGGTVSMELDKDDIDTLKDLLGHSVATQEETANAEDVIPYVGVGRVTKLMVNGAVKYRGTVLSLVKFKEPAEQDNTKGESIEFNTTTLEGEMLMPEDGNWRKRKIFDSKTDAINYIETALGRTSGTSGTSGTST